LYKMIRAEFPSLPILYFSDSGEVPYGKLPKKTLRARVEKVFDFLAGHGAERIIVACHSASSVVLPRDKNVTGLRLQTVKSGYERKAIASWNYRAVGRTIRSGYYRTELHKAGVKTRQRVAQQLSILVERGEVDSPAVDKAVSKIIRPLGDCGTILLACTHYPVLSAVILKHATKGTKLIDPVEELYKSVYSEIKRFAGIKGDSEFFYYRRYKADDQSGEEGFWG